MIGTLISDNDRITKEKLIYDKYVPSVFTVFGDAGHGSGFLIDSDKGLIATNYHVISGSKNILVKINDSLKVKSRVVASSKYDDMAIIQINPNLTINIMSCDLAPQKYELFIGESIYAIGSPLNQTELFSKGIISKVLERAILSSDLNINQGNSGGPLFNSEEYVIGISTFGDQNQADKISGIIRINALYPLIEQASNFITKNVNVPDGQQLQVIPNKRFPLDSLKASVFYNYNPKLYKISNSKYYIHISTPMFEYHTSKQYKLELAKKRLERLKKSNIDEKEILEDYVFSDLYSWYHDYIGVYEPVVTISVVPKSSLTAGALIGNIIVGSVIGVATFDKREYKSDLHEFNLKINNIIKPDVKRSISYNPLYLYTGDYTSKDLAKVGKYQYLIDLFSPVDGEIPEVSLEISDVSRPNEPIEVKFTEKQIIQIWKDFLPYTQKHDEWALILDNKRKKEELKKQQSKNTYGTKKPW
tara:strand:- start:800 stop:2221 length:1422 start_codon:yes stop_codon:yes gene_type:complete